MALVYVTFLYLCITNFVLTVWVGRLSKRLSKLESK